LAATDRTQAWRRCPLRRLARAAARKGPLGNRNHLRSFGRSLIRVLVELGADEAAAVLDGATSDQPEFTEMVTGDPTDIEKARARLGPVDEIAFARGAAMTDDELVEYLDADVSAAGPEVPSA
jgi:hypothetical protein